MALEGYIEYQRREYCRAIECPVQILLQQEPAGSEKYNQTRKICQTACLHTTHEFHTWLIEKGYLVIRPN
jgi:hypothetical protein